MRSRKYPPTSLRTGPSTGLRTGPSTGLRTGPGHAGGRLREWLARWLGVGKTQRLRAETRAEALTTAYRHKLVNELHNLKILDMTKPFDSAQDRPFDLETSYVPLQVREYNQYCCATGAGGEFSGRVRESEMAKRKGSVGDLRPSMSPEEALVRFRHLAVLGDPGAGKTTLLRYLTLLSAQGKLENLPDFPILVHLGHFAAVPQVNLLDFVISQIEAHYGFPELRPYLEERLEKGSVLFFLDGLDEANVGDHSAEPFVPRPVLSPSASLGIDSLEGLRTEGLTMKTQEAEATYRHIVGQINVLAARYPNCPMVVTTRRASWKGLLAARFHILEMLEFNRGDIQRFIVNWFGATDGENSTEGARGLQDALSQNVRMGALAANPLLLSLMAFVFEQDRKLPEGRAGLYERGVELLLSTADGENLPDSEHKRSLLEKIALHLHFRRVLLLPEDELREVMAGLEEISGPHGLLQEQISGWVGFPHPTWQEYFAAAAISKGGQLEWVLEGLHDPWWEGTALFLAGILEDATPLLEGILAQEEDIFYSNLLLAGRCLASISPIEGVGPSSLRPFDFAQDRLCSGQAGPGQRLWEDVIEELKRLVERGTHGLLQRQAARVLAEIGGEAVVSFFVALLRREEVDLDVRAEVAKILGSLHPFDGVYPEQGRRAQDRDKSVVLDLLACLTDEKLASSLRRNVAEALGSLGDESVIPPLLALLSDERLDASVRGKVVEALGRLGGESVVSALVACLPDEGIDPTVRERISAVLGPVLSRIEGLSPSSILHPLVVSQLLSLLPDEEIHPSVRRGVAEAVGSLGDESVVPDLLALLSEEEIDPSVRGKVAEALGRLGDASAVQPLLAILGDEKVDYSVRMMVAEVLGVLGKNSAPQLLALLSDEKIDPDVRTSIADTLGVLGDKTMVPQLLSLLPDERIDPAVRWRIVDALSSLGDKTIIPHLRALLPNEKIDSSVRWMVAEALEALAGEGGKRMERREWRGESGEGRMMEEALGSLNDRSRVPQFLALLKDKKLDPSVSGRIIEALGTLGDDRATVEGLAALLDREGIGCCVYEALFQVSRRAGMRVFARKGGGYEVRP